MTGRRKPWCSAVLASVACIALVAGCGTRVRSGDAATGLNTASGQRPVPEALVPAAAPVGEDGANSGASPVASPSGAVTAGSVAAGTPTSPRATSVTGGTTNTTAAR